MQLNRKTVEQLSPRSSLSLPAAPVFSYPEKVLQFGTGTLLRALVDRILQQYNDHSFFCGRAVLVKSIPGDLTQIRKQDHLYTVVERGLERGKPVERAAVIATVSRVISAETQWEEVLACAANPDLWLIVSNTTEVGIIYTEEKIGPSAPASFPGKLLALLRERYIVTNGDPDSGFTIVATELIPDNGKTLEAIVTRLARFNQLDERFIEWMRSANLFCNSLVDRIVTGKPKGEQLKEIEARLGYEDDWLTTCEPYALWVVQGNETLRKRLMLPGVDSGLIVVDDLRRYLELKLRLLNGVHSLVCGMAMLAGYTYTRECFSDTAFVSFVRKAVINEFFPFIGVSVDEQVKEDYLESVFERFANPFIDHRWHSISFQYTSKIKTRILPMLKAYQQSTGAIPQVVAMGFAAYLQCIAVVRKATGKYFGEIAGIEFELTDDALPVYYLLVEQYGLPGAIPLFLANKEVWGEDLTRIPGFQEQVLHGYGRIRQEGIRAVLQDFGYTTTGT